MVIDPSFFGAKIEIKEREIYVQGFEKIVVIFILSIVVTLFFSLASVLVKYVKNEPTAMVPEINFILLDQSIICIIRHVGWSHILNILRISKIQLV